MKRKSDSAYTAKEVGDDRETGPKRAASVTAVAVGPGRVFVHWRIVGEDPRDLVLRVHDVTGRLFDGENSRRRTVHDLHSAVGSTFLEIDRATEEVIVDVTNATVGDLAGVRPPLARSSRVVLPGRSPAHPRQVKWLTMTQAAWDQRREPVESWSIAIPLLRPSAGRRPWGGSERIAGAAGEGER